MTMQAGRIKPIYCLLLLGMLTGILPVGVRADRGDDFGRLFTTPKERERLDEIRNSAGTAVHVKETELNVKETAQKAEPKHEDITVKGVVYRSDGKNTAWLNDTNSNEGDVASEYLKVDEHNVGPEGVKLVLPGKKKPVHLKVGESYDTGTDQTNDILPKNDLVK